MTLIELDALPEPEAPETSTPPAPMNRPAERPLDMRETPEFLAIAARVRDGLRAGHSYED